MTYARKAKASDIGYKKGRLSTTVPALPVSDDYRNNYDLIDWTDGQSADRAEPGKQSQEHNG